MRPSRRQDLRGPAVDVVIASTRWSKAPQAAKLVRRTIAAAAPARARAAELSVILTSNRAIGALNRQWRGQDKPTKRAVVSGAETSDKAHGQASGHARRAAPSRRYRDRLRDCRGRGAGGAQALRSSSGPFGGAWFFCIFWDTITNRIRKPKPWSGANA